MILSWNRRPLARIMLQPRLAKQADVQRRVRDLAVLTSDSLIHLSRRPEIDLEHAFGRNGDGARHPVLTRDPRFPEPVADRSAPAPWRVGAPVGLGHRDHAGKAGLHVAWTERLATGRLDDRPTVLGLTFAERLRYTRKEELEPPIHRCGSRHERVFRL